MKFEDLPCTAQMMIYLEATLKDNPVARFCTSNIELQQAADELITKGLVEEIEGPGGADRAFALTAKGKKLMNISE